MRYARLPWILSLFALLTSCAGISAYQAEGELAGQRIKTTVDAEIAKYYLENYLPGERSQPRYDRIIDTAHELWDRKPLDDASLKSLSEQFSPDFATLYFVSRLLQDPRSQKAHQTLHARLAALGMEAAEGRASIAKRDKPYLFAFVPGYAYKRDPATGADFARQRRLLAWAGLRTVLIETEEVGTVEQNAAIIADELLRLGKEHEKIILVSTSKGGAEAALALGKLLTPQQAENVKAWVSVGGLLRGTPLADRALVWPRSWWMKATLFFFGHPQEILENLGTAKRKGAFAALNFPPHLLMLQIVGVPLSGQVSPDVRKRYGILRKLGPNDGLTLLPDELVPGGVVLTDIGLDHFFRDPEIDLKSLALADLVLDMLEEKSVRCQIGPGPLTTSGAPPQAPGR